MCDKFTLGNVILKTSYNKGEKLKSAVESVLEKSDILDKVNVVYNRSRGSVEVFNKIDGNKSVFISKESIEDRRVKEESIVKLVRRIIG